MQRGLFAVAAPGFVVCHEADAGSGWGGVDAEIYALTLL